MSFLIGQSQVLRSAHLEDDYAQGDPLFNAMKYGFNSIEIDVHLVEGELLVSNKFPSPRHKNTFEQLYLLPLKQIIQQNGGRVYPNHDEPFQIVVDIKTEAGLTFDALNFQLAKYEAILQRVINDEVVPGPVLILLSGNRPIPHLWSQKKRLMAIWGQEKDISSGYPNHFIPVISTNFKNHTSWNGNGRLRGSESNWLSQFCNAVHKEGKKVHFNSYPEKRIVWDKLLEYGVDLLNTRNPKRLASFLDDPQYRVMDIPVAVRKSEEGRSQIEKNDSVELTVNPTNLVTETEVETIDNGATYAFVPPKVILTNGHAHNDYEHEKPLFDAINNGFTSLEVDIHLINGELYVYHDHPTTVDKTRTLTELYFKPLSEIVQQNDGEVYKNFKGEFYLMIDIKTDAEETYKLLKQKLNEFEQLFTKVENDIIQKGPVVAILSGNRPIETLKLEKRRLAFIDGRPGELQMGYSKNLMPLISDRFSKHFKWNGYGEMPDYELEYLNRLVEITHEEGKKIRFWASPENTTAWEILYNNGVDLINTDQLEKLSKFLASKKFQTK